MADLRLGQQLINHIRLTRPDFTCPEVFYMDDAVFLDVLGGRLVDRETIDYEAARETFRDVMERYYEIWITSGEESQVRQIVDAAIGVSDE